MSKQKVAQLYKKKPPRRWLFPFYIPMQLVAPRAVTIAVAIDAIICTMNLMVSLFVMVD
jgi:hypothetical protein